MTFFNGSPKSALLSLRGPGRRDLCRLALSVLLPLLVIFAGQGAWRHEIGHLETAAKRAHDPCPADHRPCPLCQSFAHVDGALLLASIAMPLLTHLAFSLVLRPMPELIARIAIAPRSRGPPEARD